MFRSKTLTLAPGGRLLGYLGHSGGIFFDRTGHSVVKIEQPDIQQLVAFPDQLWVFAGAEPRLYRRDLRGLQLGEALELPMSWAAASALLSLGLTLAMGAAELLSTQLLPRSELLAKDDLEPGALWIPLGAQSSAVVHQGQVLVRRRQEQFYFALPDELQSEPVQDGVALRESRELLLLLGERDPTVLLLELRSGRVRKRISLGEALLVRLLSGPQQLLVLREPSRLQLVDLASGSVLADWLDEQAISDLAVDSLGSHVVLLRERDGTPAEFAVFPYQQLLGQQPALGAPGETIQQTLHRLDGPVAVAALSPRPQVRALAEDELLQSLEDCLDLVAAWCKRGIALGWDSGRISGGSKSALPFGPEVAAILDGQAGQAAAELEQALHRARLAEQHYSERWRAPRQRAQTSAQTSAPSEQPAESPLALSPLELLALEYQLADLATEILLVVAAPYLWGELSRMYGIIANDPARPLCDELLVAQIIGPQGATRREIAWELSPEQPLIRHGLLQRGPGARPFAALHVSSVVIERLWGQPVERPAENGFLTPYQSQLQLAELQLAHRPLVELLHAVARPPRSGHLRLLLRGRSGSGRSTVMSILARHAGRPLGRIDASQLARDRVPQAERLRLGLHDAWLRGFLPCVSGLEVLMPGAGQTAEDRSLGEHLREVFRGHPGPLVFRGPPGWDPPLDPGFVTVELPRASVKQRARSWHTQLVRHQLPTGCAEELAARFHLEAGTIQRVCAQVAPPLADSREQDPDSAGARQRIEEAVRQHRAARLGGVATLVERLPSWSDIVLPVESLDSLREFVGRLRHRYTVMERWGFDRLITSSRGLTALFQGGSGTGKSMAAGIIARELGFQLYRVDLGRVLSKWIGETERNLGAAFDAAEEGEVVLLFDEADSLFARRTEVNSSVDRYANVEVNYLLQRLDAFEGVVILTSNFGSSIDAAFKRRLSLRLQFPFPDEEMREQLWRNHLPKDLPIEGPLDLRLLAEKFELSGGYIRNAALRAAFLAAQEQRPLGQEHLERAVRLEYREMGKIIESGVLE